MVRIGLLDISAKVVNSTRVTRMNRIKIFDWVDFFDPGQTRVRSLPMSLLVAGLDEHVRPMRNQNFARAVELALVELHESN